MVKSKTQEELGKMVERFKKGDQIPTQLEKALGASEENYREIFNAPQDALLIHDPKTGAIVDVNQRACEMLKYSREELIKGSLDFLSSGESPYTQEEALGWIHKALSEGPQTFEWLAKDSENKLFWIEVNLKHCVIKGSDRILAASRDITDRKKTEDGLKDIYLQQKAILDNIPDMAWLKDKEGRFIAVNEPFCKSCSYKPEEIVGKTALDIWSRDLAEIYQADDRDVIETEKRKSVEERLEDKEGRMLFMEIIKTPIYNDKGEIVGTVGIARDVTEKKRAREALQRSVEKSRRLAQENAAIAEIGRIISSTLNLEEMYERFAEKVHKLIPFDRIAIGSINSQDGTITVSYNAGTEVLGRSRGDCFFLAGSASEELIGRKSGILIDMKNEDVFKDRFRGLLIDFQSGIRSMIAVPLILKDQVIGVIILQSLRVNAYTEEDLTMAERVSNQIAGAIANAQLFAENERSERERGSLQAQLFQSQKMETIGQLAGGIAHDFNNLLTVISGQCQLSLRELREDDPLKEKLRDIEKAAEQAANLTRQLLAFSRRQILEMKVVNLNIILEDIEKMLLRTIGEHIELISVLADDLGPVKVDPGQMEQVIINLAVNARDAMPEGGKLFIETANVDLYEKDRLSHMGMLPGAYVMLSMNDTGVGMNEEVKEQIFDPFFTTKEKGKGTGLGLSTVYGIVKQSGGDIYVYSEVGKGTAFKIYLPRVFEPLEEFKEEALPGEIPQGNETVLVVEDDSSVRKLAVNILMMQGYKVLEAAEGEEALIICEKENNPIHIILTDVVMPNMDGPQLIERLKQTGRDFKVLYMSGYADETIIHHRLVDRGVAIVHKPFTVEKLARKIREVLDKN